ncbi:MAG: hypothetical protein H8E44_02545, partial [Planctomycetes bacterium]|nr:hypothetical protein [Planctomycetota bacterium]
LKRRLLPAARTITVLERAKAEDVRIYLTYELQNVGEKPAKFLPWDTPLEEGGRGLECMGPDGNEAKYRGKYVDRGVPDAKHFLTIRPGQTLARSFRLPYDLSEPGTYTVSLRPGRPGRFEWIIKSYYGGDAEKAKQNSDNVWTGTITSNTVTVQILHATLQPAKKQEDTISERIR